MQLHPNLLAILAAIYILEPPVVVAVVIPRPLQAYINLDPALIVRRQTVGGLQFYRRKATIHEDWKHMAHDARLPDSAYIPKAKRAMNAPFVLGPGAIETDNGERPIFISNHGKRRFFHRHILARRQLSASVANTAGSGIQGLPGTIDIMSPTVESPVGEKIASLSVSTEASEENQFVLNASGRNASTVYLVVKSPTPMQDGTLTVALQVPVFDQAKASYVPYCATFDTSQASPLTAAECSDQEISDYNSQLFSYNSTSGVIKPLWMTSSPPPDMASSPASKEEDITSDSQEESEESDPVGASNSTAPEDHNVSLVFTPGLDSSTPVVNSQSSQDNTDPNHLPLMASSTSTTSAMGVGMAMDTSAPSDASVVPTATVDDVGTAPTMCRGSPMEFIPAPSVTVSEYARFSGDAEFSPMTGESASITASSTESTMPSETSVTSHRRDIGTGDGEELGGEETDDEESQATLPDETSEQEETKRAVDTAYVWRFRKQ